tara:strand:+ start:369 stop:995 length:627 start_codon:yes stop_codon:yes gene_type:complete
MNLETLKQFVDVLHKFKISANQYLFMAMIYHRRYELFKKFADLDSETVDPKTGVPFMNNTIRQSEIRQLEVRGMIIDTNKDDEYYPEKYILGDGIETSIFDNKLVNAHEFWDAYPDTFPVRRGNNVTSALAKSTDKDALLVKYASKVKTDKKHKEMLELLEKYKRLIDKGLINGMGIEKYISSEVYNTIRNLDDNDRNDGSVDYSQTI